jgi:uncharacterized protein (DUF362 family)
MGAAAGGALLLGKSLFAESKFQGRQFLIKKSSEAVLTLPDLVAVKNGEPDVMFDKAIAEYGGMSTFVKKGQTVLVKPNIGWNCPPEAAATTNPKLVRRIIEHCFNAGAKKVFVFDHTCDSWELCYETSTLEKTAKDAGATVAPANMASYYQDVDLKGASKLTKTKVHELYLQADVIINVPILKNHSGSTITAAMKNLMGVVWDRGDYHSFRGLDTCIADFCVARKPDLNVIDAYNIMTKNGPRGFNKQGLVLKKSLLVSKDILAADTAAVKLFGLDPTSITYLLKGKLLGIGSMDLDKMNIKRITL